MVTIITGKINGGKTSRMQTIHSNLKRGDGFITPKAFENGQMAGYDIRQLSTGETCPFIRKTGALPAGWDEAFTYGAFSFSQKALEMAEGIIKTAIENGVNPLFMDEIGPVELAGKGFASLLEKGIRSGSDLYICARESCVEAVAERYHIQEVMLIKV